MGVGIMTFPRVPNAVAKRPSYNRPSRATIGGGGAMVDADGRQLHVSYGRSTATQVTPPKRPCLRPPCSTSSCDAGDPPVPLGESLVDGFTVCGLLTPSRISDRVSSCCRIRLRTLLRAPSRKPLPHKSIFSQSLYMPVQVMLFAIDVSMVELIRALMKGLKAGMMMATTAPKEMVTISMLSSLPGSWKQGCELDKTRRTHILVFAS